MIDRVMEPHVIAAVALAACGFLVQCGDQQDMRPCVERAVHEAVVALVARQSDDGAWRSQTYGTLADGPELTPTVLKAVMLAPETALTRDACARGLSYLDTISFDTLMVGSFGEREFERDQHVDIVLTAIDETNVDVPEEVIAALAGEDAEGEDGEIDEVEDEDETSESDEEAGPPSDS